MMTSRRYTCLVLSGALACCPGLVTRAAGPYQVTLDTNTNLNDGAALGPIVKSGGDGSPANPCVYHFTAGGLNLDVFKVYTDTSGTVKKGSFTLDMGGYDLDGTGVVAFSTACYYVGTVANDAYGSIAVTNVGNVSLGGIDTQNTGGGWYYGGGGDVKIGTATVPAAGNVRCSYINTRSSGKGSYGGNVTIYGQGNVRIEDAAGTPGNIVTIGERAAGSDVTVYHRGLFAANTIDARTIVDDSGQDSGNITLDGNWNNGATPPSGSLAVSGDIRNNAGTPGSGFPNTGQIVIRGYSSVTVSNVCTLLHGVSNASRSPGSCAITNIAGNIAINGLVDLRSDLCLTNSGKLLLQTTSASGGTITLGANTNHVFYCDYVLYTTFRSGQGKSYIKGEVRMPGATDTDKRNNVSTYLKGNAGQTVYYNHKVASNAWLGGGIYSLGTDGSGTGFLAPIPTRGTVVWFK
jgi:hypothetical protein